MERGHQISAKIGYTAQILFGVVKKLTAINKAALKRDPMTEKTSKLLRFAKAIASGHHMSAYAGKIAQGNPLKTYRFNIV
jgi:hypothetical protein